MGSLAAHSIITNGLTCGRNSACENGAVITTFFSLYCTGEAPPEGGGGGGTGRWVSRVLQPGEIQQLYQPVAPEQQYYVVPRDQEARYFKRPKYVSVKLTMGRIVVEKEFAVYDKRVRAVVQVINLINSTQERMSVVVKGINRISHYAIVKIKNLRRTK